MRMTYYSVAHDVATYSLWTKAHFWDVALGSTYEMRRLRRGWARYRKLQLRYGQLHETAQRPEPLSYQDLLDSVEAAAAATGNSQTYLHRLMLGHNNWRRMWATAVPREVLHTAPIRRALGQLEADENSPVHVHMPKDYVKDEFAGALTRAWALLWLHDDRNREGMEARLTGDVGRAVMRSIPAGKRNIHYRLMLEYAPSTAIRRFAEKCFEEFSLVAPTPWRPDERYDLRTVGLGMEPSGFSRRAAAANAASLPDHVTNPAADPLETRAFEAAARAALTGANDPLVNDGEADDGDDWAHDPVLARLAASDGDRN
jgi:hypothetical protein